MTDNQPVPFISIEDESLYGGKCLSLGSALRAGLPVPDGFGLDHQLVEQVARDDESAIARVKPLLSHFNGPVSVRSSAVGEDSEGASFAGQHVSVLNVETEDDLIQAVKAVYDSAHTDSAMDYRKKMGLDEAPRIAVAVQLLVQSEVSGVMFSRHPVTHETEHYIEAAWGLGEVIVAGLVVPDTFRINPKGDIIERTAGEKDVMVVSSKEGGTEEIEVEEALIEKLCLDDKQLKELHELASRCEKTYGSGLDMEWAFAEGKLYLLQCRSITISA